jgi:tripartite-type tricarboxylate transporter receptor subunit TctC
MTLLRIAALALLMSIALPEARSQSATVSYPERPIRLIVPFPAGGINDVLARAWADKIAPHLGTIVIENRGGGGSMIGSAEAARAAPDGYTLLLGNSTNQVLNPQLMKSPPFDPAKDFIAVTILTKIPNVIVVHGSLPVHNLKELAAYARANPGKLSYAWRGSMTHLSGEQPRNWRAVSTLHVLSRRVRMAEILAALSQ